MATKEDMQVHLNAVLDFAMEKNKAALIEAYWSSGAALVTWEADGVVVKPVPESEFYTKPERKD